MATYIIGDVQGCYRELQDLLQYIAFNPDTDRLGFVGDLVNRGPHSLEVLRFIKNLKSPLVVLGNHDLYLLIIAYGLMPKNAYTHTLETLLRAPDKIELIDWLRHQPLVHHEKEHSAVLVHAGLPPQWSILESTQRAQEVADALCHQKYPDFLRHLFGNEPLAWHSDLSGQPRLRYITNAFTRMRFCSEQGALDLTSDGLVSANPQRFSPWFEWRDPEKDNTDVIFGHWAVLGGQCSTPHCYALDTGCAWGYSLTALRLEDKKRFSVPCRG